jgi:hypothetical protein
VSASARAASISRRLAYERRRQDEEFRLEWDSAMEEALDELEGELRQRALGGTEKPVFYAGKACGMVRSYNDNLGMFLLKNRRHEVFGENKSRLAQSVNDEDSAIAAASAREKLHYLLATLTDDAGEGGSEDQ